MEQTIILFTHLPAFIHPYIKQCDQSSALGAVSSVLNHQILVAVSSVLNHQILVAVSSVLNHQILGKFILSAQKNLYLPMNCIF